MTALERRAFIMTALMTGFAPAAASAAANPIHTGAEAHTGAEGLVAGPVKIPVADGTLPGYAARPQGHGPFPIVLVIEEIFGVHEYIQDVCRRLAHEGFLAVAPELYARLADLSTMTDPQEIITKVILRAPDAQLLDDLDRAVDWAQKNGGDTNRLGVLGFCRGGRDTWLYAEHQARLRAAVAFYGPVTGKVSAIQPKTPLDLAAGLKCPLLGLYGGKDGGIAVADVERAASLARASGQTVKIEVFPEAGHGFHADYRDSYVPDAARRAWTEALGWLRAHGVG